MRKHPIAATTVLVAVAFVFAGYLHAPVEGQAGQTSIAAVPSEKGGQDVFGAYDVAAWPKPLSTRAGTRDVDVGRRSICLRREPEPRVRPAAWRAARAQAAAAADPPSADRTERRVPDVPPAAARRDQCKPT